MTTVEARGWGVQRSPVMPGRLFRVIRCTCSDQIGAQPEVVSTDNVAVNFRAGARSPELQLLQEVVQVFTTSHLVCCRVPGAEVVPPRLSNSLRPVIG